MSVNPANWKAVARTFKSVCRRWVNPAIRDEAELTLQGRIFAFLFALPPLALTVTLMAAAGGNRFDASLTALAIALPVLAASWLSLSGSPRVRNVVIGAGGLMFVLASAASPGAVLAAASIVAVQASKWVLCRQTNWIIWLASALAALCASLFLIIADPGNIGKIELLCALPVVFFAAVASNWSRNAVRSATKTDSEPKALHTESAQLAALADHSGALLALVGRNGVVAQATGRSSADWLTPAALQGRGLVESTHIADRPGFLAWIGGLMVIGNDQTINVRLSRPGSNGGSDWIKCSFMKIQSGENGFLLSIVAEDIKGRIHPETNAIAVGSLGHELRTPLNAIVGFSEMLRDGFCGPLASTKQIEYLDLIHNASRHLLQVSNAMLDWSQLESRTRHLNAERFVPAEAASLAIGILSADAQAKRVGLDFEPGCGLDDFCGDERALTQILVNLLSNAIKFAPENGLIRLAIDIENDCLTLSVCDNGPGFGSGDQERVGTPFFRPLKTGSDTPAGAGLGLSIVRELTRIHGGSMQIESEPGKGTCVKVALPALRLHQSNIAGIMPAGQDETTRIIRLFEERGHATNRKTA